MQYVAAKSIIIALAMTSISAASGADLSVRQLKHTVFLNEQGAPSNIKDISQGADGLLWITSADGLFRFDGLTFEKIDGDPLATGGNTQTAVLATRDGSVWIGHNVGGVSRYRSGQFRDVNFVRKDLTVANLVEARDGSLWAQTSSSSAPLARYAHGRWQILDRRQGLPFEQAADVLPTRDGSVWYSSKHGLYRVQPGRVDFRPVLISGVESARLAEDPGGGIWLADPTGLRALSPSGLTRLPYPLGAEAIRGAIFDREGSLWLRTPGDGLVRVRKPKVGGESTAAAATQQVEHFRVSDTLSSDIVLALLKDTEGNVWTATSLGLDRFRWPAVIREPLLENVPFFAGSLGRTSDGRVFVGMADGLFEIAPRQAPRLVLGNIGDVDALCIAPNDSVWVVGADQVINFRDGVRMRLPKPHSRQLLIDCAVDGANILYVSAAEGVFRRTGATWALLPNEQTDDTDGEMPLIRTQNGAILTYGTGSELRFFRDGRRGKIAFSRPGMISHLRTIAEIDNSFVLGGHFGLVRVRNGRANIIPAQRSPGLVSVTGVTRTGDGQFWTIGSRGIAQYDAANVDRVFDDPRVPLRFRLYDVKDGLRSPAMRDGKHDVVEGGDGRLWFSTGSGVVWIDRRNLPRNDSPPMISVTAIRTSKARWLDPENGVRLPKGASSLAIDFKIANLGIPERATVQYQMEGVDDGWVNAGPSRTARYTNLGAGTYHFLVKGSNEFGIESGSPKELTFVIPPTFVQSLPFKILALLALGLILWVLYKTRTRQLTARLRERFEAQQTERERIARELHDTLLQGFQGLLLRFQSVANRMDREDSLSVSLNDALEKAEATLTEGRDRVATLRSERSSTNLLNGLKEMVAGLDKPDDLTIQMTVSGMARPTPETMNDEIVRTMKEAATNAVRHAKASVINLDLEYAPRAITVQLIDNGIGIPDPVIDAGGRENHFGLQGMRERAQRLGAKLLLTTNEGKGTSVHLVVPITPEAPRWRTFFDGLASMFPRAAIKGRG